MATLHLFKLGAVAAVVVLLTIGVFMVLKLWPRRGDVPLLSTPDWKGKNIHEPNSGRLLLRRETLAGGALLLKRVDLETVYRYDPQARSLSSVTDKEWLSAGGPIGACSGAGSTPPMAPVRFDGPNYKLLIAGREASTAGKLALDYLISPTGKWVAVLSAPGPVLPQFFWEGDHVLGQRYHQVLSVPDAVSAGAQDWNTC